MPRFLNSEVSALDLLSRRAPRLGLAHAELTVTLDFSHNLAHTDEALSVWLRALAARGCTRLNLTGVDARVSARVSSLAAWLIPHATIHEGVLA